MGEREVATLPPAPADTTGWLAAWSATTCPDVGLGEVLAAWSMLRPDGLLVLEPAGCDDLWTFLLRGGRVCGAQGSGAFDCLDTWLPERRHRHAARGAPSVPDPTLRVEYVRERLLDQLMVSTPLGSRALLLRGNFMWMDTVIDPDAAPSLEHLMLECARRQDEWPSVQAYIKPGAVPVPARDPAVTASANAAEMAQLKGSDAPSWDFVEDPDEAATEEWSDVRLVYSMCEGASSIREVLEESLLGEYRTAAAICTLVRCGNLNLLSMARSTRPNAHAANEFDPAALLDLRADEAA